jgi:hypothetical protein
MNIIIFSVRMLADPNRSTCKNDSWMSQQLGKHVNIINIDIFLNESSVRDIWRNHRLWNIHWVISQEISENINSETDMKESSVWNEPSEWTLPIDILRRITQKRDYTVKEIIRFYYLKFILVPLLKAEFKTRFKLMYDYLDHDKHM